METVRKPGAQPGNQNAAGHGAPLGNANRTAGGERSRKPPLHRAGKGDGHLLASVRAWRRDIEGELTALAGPLSALQEALICTAANWELCRRRRGRLAHKAAGDAERITHEEMAATNAERRDKALAAAGLGKASGDSPAGDPWSELDRRRSAEASP